jgi:hypothetical protein
MAKPSSRTPHCRHIPANPASMQTSCEKCGRIIEPRTPDSDSWRLAFAQPPLPQPRPSYRPGDVRLGAMNVALFGPRFNPGNDGQHRIKPTPFKAPS